MLSFHVFLMCLGVTIAQQFKFLDSKNQTKLKVVRLGSTTVIDCETTDASAEVKLWKIEYGKRTEVKESLNDIKSGQIFTMHKLALEDAGKYKCTAKDSFNKKISKKIILLIDTSTPGLVIRPSTRPAVALTGSTVKFHCEAVRGKIIWIYYSDNGKHSPLPSKYTNVNETILNDSKSLSTLTIPNAQVFNSGVYECRLVRYKGFYRNVYLKVQDPKKPAFTNVNSQPQLNIVKRGHSKKLYCTVNGFPKPVISWEKDGVPINLCISAHFYNCQDKSYSSQDNGMMIESARFPEDNGTYTCVAKNQAGVSRKDIHVVVEVKPLLDKSHLIVIDRSKIKCHAKEGNPPPTFHWTMQLYYILINSQVKKHWFPLKQFKNTATASQDGMTSTILPRVVTMAFYKCMAVNSAGQDTHTFQTYLSRSNPY